MKRLVITLCFILAFPIFFSSRPGVSPWCVAQAQNCVDPGSPGNTCDDAVREPTHKKKGSTPKNDSPINNTVTEIEVVTFLILLWLRMRS